MSDFLRITSASSDEEIIDAATLIAERVLAPRAEETDRSIEPNRDTFRILCECGFAGITVGKEFGGIGASESVRRRVTEIFGSACGVTNFTLVQHWGACGLIQRGDNEDLHHRVLPALATGEEMCGVGFAHLRRSGPPALSACEVANGYELTGFIPWFSGWGLYRNGVLAATLPDHREIFLFSPVEESECLRASPPMRLCAMQASATVRVTLDRFFIANKNTCFIGEPNWLRNRDCTNIVGHSFNPITVAAASINLLRQVERKKLIAAIDDTAEALATELDEVRKQVDFWSEELNKKRPDYTPRALETRAHSIDLGVRAAHAAVVASGGAGIALSNPAQRYYREALFYSIQGLTEDVIEVTLNRISAGRGTRC